MSILTLIADSEEALAEKFDASIAVADEKAMSAKSTPYRNVASLTDAVIERMPS